MLSDMALMSYDLGALVKGRHYLRTQEMGPVEGKIKVPAESSEEDSDSEEEEEEEDEGEEDMTLRE